MNLLDLDASLYAATVGLVTHLSVISFVRRREVVGATISWWSHFLWAAFASAVVTGCYLVSVESGRVMLVVAAAALAAPTSIVFAKMPVQPYSGRRWGIQAMCALLASCVGLAVERLPTLSKDATDSTLWTSPLHETFNEARLAAADRPVVAICDRNGDPLAAESDDQSGHTSRFSVTAVSSRTQMQ